MALPTRRTGPLGELAGLRERFDRMFEDIVEREPGMIRPAIDVVDRDDALVMRAEVPGMTPEEVSIELADDVLTIRGRHEESKEEKEERFVRRERRVGSFARSVVLPPGTDPDAIEATVKDGVLEVRIPHPKSEEPKRIEVKAKD